MSPERYVAMWIGGLGPRPAVPTSRGGNDPPPSSGTSLGAVTMRHLTAVASLAATLTLLISTPEQARTTMHAGGHFVADHHRAVVSSRFALIADTRFGNRSVSLDRFPRRF